MIFSRLIRFLVARRKDKKAAALYLDVVRLKAAFDLYYRRYLRTMGKADAEFVRQGQWKAAALKREACRLAELYDRLIKDIGE